MPVLLVEKGPEKGLSLPAAQEMIIGRDPKCALKIGDMAVSRKHCQIVYRDHAYYVEDLQSLNGTQVNGQFITSAVLLKDNDQIGIGETLLLWQEHQIQKDALIGRDLAGYRIMERLGKGGMGTVYRARQLSLDRDVAFKMLDPSIAKDKTFIQRFIQEARSCATLNHPNIIQVYDVGECEGYFYFSMEYAKGGSIQSLVAGGKSLPWQEVLPLMLDTAMGLEYAEKKKMVHRDIKPDNLMLTEDKHVKIVDLGLARRFDQSPAIHESKIYGTPHYVSPEQIRGLGLDHRADMYSFGASFYRILSGKAPFQCNSVAGIITKHLTEVPPTLKELLPNIPAELSAMIAKMMQKAPEERYSSHSEILQILKRLMAEPTPKTSVRSTPIVSMNRSTVTMQRKDVKRRSNPNKISNTAAIFIGTFLFGIVFSLYLFLHQEPIAKPNAESLVAEQAYQKAVSLWAEGKKQESIAELEKISREHIKTAWAQKARAKAEEFREQQRQEEQEYQASLKYQEIKTYEQSFPQDLEKLLEKYKSIEQGFPQTNAASLAQKAIERLKAELQKKQGQEQQKFAQFLEQYTALVLEEKYAQAWHLLEAFAKEYPKHEQLQAQRNALEEKIAEWVQAKNIAIQQLIGQKKWNEAKQLLETMTAEPTLPLITTKAEELNKLLQSAQAQEALEQIPLLPLAEKTAGFLAEYNFAQGHKELAIWIFKAPPSQKSQIQTVAHDFRMLANFWEELNERWQQSPFLLPQSSYSALGNMSSQAKKIEILGLENAKLTIRLTTREATIENRVSLKTLSPQWVYEALLQPNATEKEHWVTLCLYCFYYRLYLNAWACGTRIERDGIQAERWKQIQLELTKIEDQARQTYTEEIVLLYQSLKELKKTWQKMAKASPEFEKMKQEIQAQNDLLQKKLQEYVNTYQNTKFFSTIKD